METFCDIIDAWEKLPEFCADVGITESHARTLKARKRIPPRYWERLVNGAAERGISGITLPLLARIAANNATRKKSSQTVANNVRHTNDNRSQRKATAS